MANEPELAPTHGSLLARIKDWEDDASWKEFFDIYGQSLFAQARKYGLTPCEAEDVVQEILLAIAKKIEALDYNPRSFRFRAWLFTISKCRIIDRLRKQARERRFIMPSSEALFEWLRRGMAVPSDAAAYDNADSTTTEDFDAWIGAHYSHQDAGDGWHRQVRAESVIERAKDELRKTLPSRDYQVFHYCTIHGKKPRHVGSLLGMNVVAVYKVNYQTRTRFVELARSIWENSNVRV